MYEHEMEAMTAGSRWWTAIARWRQHNPEKADGTRTDHENEHRCGCRCSSDPTGSPYKFRSSTRAASSPTWARSTHPRGEHVNHEGLEDPSSARRAAARHVRGDDHDLAGSGRQHVHHVLPRDRLDVEPVRQADDGHR